jgi:hypothetical protein
MRWSSFSPRIRQLVRARPDKLLVETRAQLLHAALGIVSLRAAPHHPALAALHGWLDSWRGVGDVVVGMHRQGYDVQLTQYNERGWRATFYTTGMEHSATRATASAFEETPWRGVQRAAWEALANLDRG